MATEAPLGPSWGILGPSWDPHGGLLGCLGGFLGRLQRREGRNVAYAKNIRFPKRNWKISTSRGPLGCTLGGLLRRLGRPLGPFGAILGVLERSFDDSGPSWAILGASCHWWSGGRPGALQTRPPGIYLLIDVYVCIYTHIYIYTHAPRLKLPANYPHRPDLNC